MNRFTEQLHDTLLEAGLPEEYVTGQNLYRILLALTALGITLQMHSSGSSLLGLAFLLMAVVILLTGAVSLVCVSVLLIVGFVEAESIWSRAITSLPGDYLGWMPLLSVIFIVLGLRLTSYARSSTGPVQTDDRPVSRPRRWAVFWRYVSRRVRPRSANATARPPASFRPAELLHLAVALVIISLLLPVISQAMFLTAEFRRPFALGAQWFILGIAVLAGAVIYLVLTAAFAYAIGRGIKGVRARVELRREVYQLHLKEFKILGRRSRERSALPRKRSRVGD